MRKRKKRKLGSGCKLCKPWKAGIGSRWKEKELSRLKEDEKLMQTLKQ